MKKKIELDTCKIELDTCSLASLYLYMLKLLNVKD